MLDAANSLWFTAAFGIAKELIDPVAKKRDQMRFVLLEKPVPDAQKKTLTADFNRVILSYGVPLGELYRMKDGKPTARVPIKEFALDKWFFAEEHFRPSNDGFVFFVHTKFLLIDPLSDDPLVCSGSANFSSGSLLQNDENMLLVRGDTRVADIYMTEFDRIFRHFYFRDIANELAGAKTSDDAKAIFLDETDAWTESYFKPGTLKNNRRLMFFDSAKTTWFANAAKGGEPGDEAVGDEVGLRFQRLARAADAARVDPGLRRAAASRQGGRPGEGSGVRRLHRGGEPAAHPVDRQYPRFLPHRVGTEELPARADRSARDRGGDRAQLRSPPAPGWPAAALRGADGAAAAAPGRPGRHRPGSA